MAVIFMSMSKQQLDGSIRKKVYDLMEKLQADPKTSGLHIEPIKNAADPRIRSARVNDQFRALLFKLTDGDNINYIYVGTWPHDKAYEEARTLRLKRNPINGVTSVVRIEPEEVAEPASLQRAKDAAAQAAAQAEREAAEAAEAAASASQVEAAEGEVARGEAAQGEAAEASSASARENVPSVNPAEDFAAAGHTVDSLHAEFGIDRATLQAALSAQTVDELERRVAAAAPWENEALLGLAAGYSIAEIKAQLSLSETVAASGNEDQDLLAGLSHPASKMQFAALESREELRNAIESPDFQAWTTFLHPTQRHIATRKLNGPGRVSGGAGTGKTVVALHRARNLATGAVPGAAGTDASRRILLSTFTRTLSESLAAQLSVLDATLPRARKVGDPGVSVFGIDQVTMAVLKGSSREELAAAGEAVLGRALDRAPSPLIDVDDQRAWEDAVDRAADAPAPELCTPEFLRSELELVILPNRVNSKAGYLKVSRQGRGQALNRKARMQVWGVIDTYLAAAIQQGHQTFPVLGALAAAALDHRAANGGTRLFDHVVVDEAQDFHAGHWLLIRALVAPGVNDIFISEDSHQRIYGNPVRLSHFGIEIVGRSRRLTLNYRTTSENLHFAMDILSGSVYTDTSGEEDSTAGYRSARSGPEPIISGEANFAAELDEVARRIRGWQEEDPAATIGVLTRNRRSGEHVTGGLEARGIEVVDPGETGVQVMTMHMAKGLEFKYVVLVGVSQSAIPGPVHRRVLTDEDKQLLLQWERSLLYVAATRARDELVVTYGGEISELLPQPEAAAKAS